MRRCRPLAALLAVILLASPAAAFDLSRATVERLDNGITVLVLEEHAVPVVSVQALYRVGARDEEVGRTGLAHFLEHMAFRASENFPATELVSRIYAVGGEWHGYTWIDQTTYFETLPRDQLDLALAIEADRMARLLLPAAEVEAERGAVLAELHGYENDPATVLKDAVVAVSFLHHPYRNNTIGWESDVERLTHADVADFYRRHYRPANAVVAVVGDVNTPDVMAAVGRHFGGLPAAGPTPPPRTVEPPQRGERRVEIAGGAGAENRFEIAYRAPAASHPDYPAFLLLREILGGTGGVNFRQEDFGVPVREGSRLAGAADDLATWAPAAAYPYVFTIAGSADLSTPRSEVEAEIEAHLAALRSAPAAAAELDAARHRLAAELVFDLETTEDAAHQLAFFDGIGALQVLLRLRERLAAVTPEDVQRVAAAYLQPSQRTVGWWLAAGAPPVVSAKGSEPREGSLAGGDPAAEASAGPPAGEAAPEPPSPAGRSLSAASAADYLEPDRAVPVRAAEDLRSAPGSPAAPAPAPSAAAPPPRTGHAAIDPPEIFRLPGGLPVAFQRSPLSPTGYFRIVVPTRAYAFPADHSVDQPVWRHTCLGFRFVREDFGATLAAARRALDAAARKPAAPPTASDPESELAGALAELLGDASLPEGGPAPVLLALAGDLDGDEVRRRLAETFGDLAPGALPPAEPPRLTSREAMVDLPGLVQARLGYAVPAPAPDHPDALAWRLLLYILSHDYEGRLGVEAIGRRGLLYYVGGVYACDGQGGWISRDMGVDPGKLAALRRLLGETLAELVTRPPTEAELAEAKAHLLGRRQTAAQSNEELTARLAREVICEGGPRDDDAYRAAVESVRREDLLRIVPAFTSGAVATVE